MLEVVGEEVGGRRWSGETTRFTGSRTGRDGSRHGPQTKLLTALERYRFFLSLSLCVCVSAETPRLSDEAFVPLREALLFFLSLCVCVWEPPTEAFSFGCPQGLWS